MSDWRPIALVEGRYEVSDDGRVRHTKSGRELRHQNTGRGYVSVNMTIRRPDGSVSKHGKRTKMLTRTVHRLMALAFIPNPNGVPEVNHIDGVKTNNVLSNLEWVTSRQNTLHSLANGRQTACTNPSKGKLSTEQVAAIRTEAAAGGKHKAIGDKYGVTESMVGRIHRGVARVYDPSAKDFTPALPKRNWRPTLIRNAWMKEMADRVGIERAAESFGMSAKSAGEALRIEARRVEAIRRNAPVSPLDQTK